MLQMEKCVTPHIDIGLLGKKEMVWLVGSRSLLQSGGKSHSFQDDKRILFTTDSLQHGPTNKAIADNSTISQHVEAWQMVESLIKSSSNDIMEV